MLVDSQGLAWPSDDAAKGYALLRAIALLSPNALLALPQAAELIAAHLGADVAGVVAYANDDTSCAVLLAAGGPAASLLWRQPLMRGPQWSACRAAEAPRGRLSLDGLLRDGLLHDPELPEDAQRLRDEAGIQSFEAVVIGDHPGLRLGALLLGSKRPGAFTSRRPGGLPACLGAEAIGLLTLLRCACVQQAARLVVKVCDAPDPISLISSLLQGTARFMWHSSNLPMALRMGLLPDGPGTKTALVFESARAGDSMRRKREGTTSSVARSSSLPTDPTADVTLCHLPLEGTLAESAFASRQPVTVQDITRYLQTCRAPARDAFSHSSVATSLVAVPMFDRGEPFGVMYFASSAHVDFEGIEGLLQGIVSCVSMTVADRLSGTMGQLRGAVREVDHQPQRQQALPCLGVPAARGNAPAMLQLPVAWSECGSEDTFAAHVVPLPGGVGRAGSGVCRSSIDDTASRGTWAVEHSLEGSVLLPALTNSSSKLSMVSDRKLYTDAMVKVIQKEIHRSRRCSLELSFMSDLTLVAEIGRGGFGTVFSGFWRKGLAAIKVMDARTNDGEAVSDAMEMAVLSSCSHPNIVQLYACLLDMVVAEDESLMSASHVRTVGEKEQAFADDPLPPPSFRRMMPGEARDAPTFNLVIMELCDKGTLRNAVDRGEFHRPPPDDPSAPPRPDLGLIVEVLLDVATALQYLHECASLVHGDVKLDNVLLKSDPLHALGFVPKLSDFGLTKVLSPEIGTSTLTNQRAAGTINHLAPEMFSAGSEITPSVDAYAFGIVMWELFTKDRAFKGASHRGIVERVCKLNARPIFPIDAPPAYCWLAGRCWQRRPADRPRFADIVVALRHLRPA